MCDNALLSGFAAGRQPVGRDLILEVVKDFDLSLPADGESSSILGETVTAYDESTGTEVRETLVIPDEQEALEVPERRRRFSLFGGAER